MITKKELFAFCLAVYCYSMGFLVASGIGIVYVPIWLRWGCNIVYVASCLVCVFCLLVKGRKFQTSEKGEECFSRSG